MTPDADIEADTEEAARAAPDTARARVLAEELDTLDASKWKRLLPILESISRRLAREAEGVACEEDVLGELALRSHERWIREWCLAVREHRASRSLWVFLHDRMRDHLREARRTQARRRALIGASGALERPDALFLSAPITPEEDVAADELRDVASGRDPQVRAILALREAGFSQDEISKMLSVSRPTITRRLAAVAVLMAAIAAVLIAIAMWPEEEAPIAIEPVPQQPAGIPMAPLREQPPPPPRMEPPPIPEPPAPPIQRARRTVVSAATGVLMIQADVPARVIVDGRPVGMTPQRLTVAPGTHSIVLEQDGYETIRRTVQVRSAETVRVVQILQRRANPGPMGEPDLFSPADAEAEARRCTMASDNACVIRVLEGRARSEGAMAMLIEAYRSRGQHSAAMRQMRVYVERFPGTPRARNYQQILANTDQPPLP